MDFAAWQETGEQAETLLERAFEGAPEPLRRVLAIEALGNPVSAWVTAALVFLAALALLMALRGFARRRLGAFAATTENQVDDLAAELVGSTRRLSLAAVAFGLALSSLDVTPTVSWWLRALIVVALCAQGGIWGDHVLAFLLRRWMRREGGDSASRAALLGLVHFFGRVAVWSVVVLVALDNLGQNVTALVAGLGVGGIAIGLALQNVLQDTFASLSIALDRPFEIGDTIGVGEFLGTVEQIGIKTTRLRSVNGEQLIFGNADLLSSRIRNFRRLTERRCLFRFGVVYDTPPDVLEKIPGLVREIVEAVPDSRFDRAHFVSLGDSALLFEVVFFVERTEYAAFLDAQQAVNLALLRGLAALDVELAFPTQTIHLVEPAPPREAPSAGVV